MARAFGLMALLHPLSEDLDQRVEDREANHRPDELVVLLLEDCSGPAHQGSISQKHCMVH